MARDILSAPMSSVAFECAFNTGEKLISDHRSSLKSETVEALICAQDWLRPTYSSRDSFEDIDEDEE